MLQQTFKKEKCNLEYGLKTRHPASSTRETLPRRGCRAGELARIKPPPHQHSSKRLIMDAKTLASDTPSDEAPRKLGWFRRVRIWIFRCFLAAFSFVAIYLLLSLIGLYPVNSSFVQPGNGIEIFIFSGAVHSDIVLPVTTETIDWRSEFPQEHFERDVTLATHAAFGWGDENFYLHTPTWSDMKVSTAVNALALPSTTVMHVAMIGDPSDHPDVRRVRVSKESYQKIVDKIQASFALGDQAQRQRIEGVTYIGSDAFYRGDGSYHMFRTCNCWVGEVMRAGGIKCGWFTPLPKSVFWHLDDED